jgi:hypothetical protein
MATVCSLAAAAYAGQLFSRVNGLRTSLRSLFKDLAVSASAPATHSPGFGALDSFLEQIWNSENAFAARFHGLYRYLISSETSAVFQGTGGCKNWCADGW